MKNATPSSRFFAFLFFLLVTPIAASETDINSLNWQYGPTHGAIDGRATITVPDSYAFLDKTDTDRYLEMAQNFSSGNEYLFLPVDMTYEAYFSFSETGYVKDEDEIDAAAILQSVTESTAAANVEKEKLGWSTLYVDGWYRKPYYDEVSNRLEWAFKLVSSDGGQVINHNTRFLGRKGVVEVILVASPENIETAINDFNQKATGFNFNTGEKYADYKDGDKLAQYGMAALIAGGAAAVAAKGGAQFIKGILIAIGVFFAAFWGRLKRFFGSKNSD
jgi:uncharacterized membrane-anchored protein